MKIPRRGGLLFFTVLWSILKLIQLNLLIYIRASHIFVDIYSDSVTAEREPITLLFLNPASMYASCRSCYRRSNLCDNWARDEHAWCLVILKMP